MNLPHSISQRDLRKIQENQEPQKEKWFLILFVKLS